MAPKRASKKTEAAPSSSHRDEIPVPEVWDHIGNTPFVEPTLILPFGQFMRKASFTNEDRYQASREGAACNDTNKSLYNSWLGMTLQPARFIDPHMLRKMGIYSEVLQMLSRIGLGNIAFQHYPIYTELAIQFYSSVELHQRPKLHPCAAFLTFSARGKVYTVYADEIYDRFGFNRDKSGRHLPTVKGWELWRKIADPTACKGRECKLSLIRNPVIRIVAEIIGSMFMGKEEPGALTNPEMALLHYGLLPEIYGFVYPNGSPLPLEMETNLGYVFIEMLAEKKLRGVNMPTKKIEVTASFLTPIFQLAGVPLEGEPVDLTNLWIDETHLHITKTLVGDGPTYRYIRPDGEVRYVKLPMDGLMSPNTEAGLVFDVPQHLQLEAPPVAGIHRPSRARGSSSRPPPRPTAQSFGFDAASAEYDLESFPDGATVEARMSILLRNQQKEHSLQRKMWDAISRIICGGGPQRSEHRDTCTSSIGAAATFIEEDDDDTESTEEDTSSPLRARSRRRLAGSP